ncbi:hypothetical protein J11TS1_37960 [Oceanobacillus sp. J11TS1]|nr:hypothetical protein J11TS1_37960 [Oceanobacillus sp. J11TS1]
MNKEKVLVFRKYWNDIEFLLKNIEQKKRKKTVQSFGFMYEKYSKKDIGNDIEPTPDKELKRVEKEAD